MPFAGVISNHAAGCIAPNITAADYSFMDSIILIIISLVSDYIYLRGQIRAAQIRIQLKSQRGIIA